MKVDFDAALLTSPERFSRCSHSQNGVQLLNAKLRWRIAPEGSGAVRRIPFGKSEANPYRPPLASPGGVAERSESFNNNGCRWQSYLDPIAGRLDGSSEPARLTEEGWRQPRYCLHFVQWHRLRVITVYLTIFRVIYHMEKGFHKTSTLLHSPNSS